MHYEFAFELINAGGADFDVTPDGGESIIWNLQYLDGETEKEQWYESNFKLQILIALICLVHITLIGNILIWGKLQRLIGVHVSMFQRLRI